MADHPFVCPNEKTIESHGRQINELFEQGRRREGRLTEIETVLFGAERNGGGFIKMHERTHAEEKQELREVLDVLRKGQDTQYHLVTEQGKKISQLTERNWWKKFVELMKVAAPIMASVAALAVALK